MGDGSQKEGMIGAVPVDVCAVRDMRRAEHSRRALLGSDAVTRYHHIFHCNGSLVQADKMDYKNWMCLICGWIYDEEAGLPEEGIAPGTRWEDVPINWTCPECGARKEDFEMVQI
jgi:rubredoxin